MQPAAELDQISSTIAIWHGYDSAVKADLFSSAIVTAKGSFLIDPIPFEKEALDELIGSDPLAGILVTNSNHHRGSAQFAEQFSIPIFARSEAFPDKRPRRLSSVADGDKICGELSVIGIEGAAAGELVLHYAPDGGTFIVGDSLINFEPYGFTFLPNKYCSNEKEMRRSLRKLLDYKAERILFAHGTPILAGASARLRRLLDGDQ